MRSLLRLTVLTCALAGAASFAQTQDVPAEPDREWGDFPGVKPAPKDNGTTGRRPLQSNDLWSAPLPEDRHVELEPEPVRIPDEPNQISMLGAKPLGKWVRGQSVVVGWPLVGIRVALGLASNLDVSVGFNSFYGLLNEPLLGARWSPLVGERWALAFQLEAGAAFFTTRAQSEGYGARWITGRRTVNIQPGLMVSFQGSHPRAARLFLNAYYLLTFDTERFIRTPLGGTSPVVGHNAGLRLGAELPLTSYTSLVVHIGAELHLRPGDALVMPGASLGLVTSI